MAVGEGCSREVAPAGAAGTGEAGVKVAVAGGGGVNLGLCRAGAVGRAIVGAGMSGLKR